MFNKLTTLLLLILTFQTLGFTQSNPLFSDEEVIDSVSTYSDTTIAEDIEVISDDAIKISFFSKLIRKNAQFQNKIKDKFANLADDYS